MHGDEQGKGPVPASYTVTNFQQYAERGYFEQHGPSHLHHLDHRDTKRGYRAGREFYFVDAEPHERRMTEGYLIERLCESVTEMAYWKDVESTWFFLVGCLLGELSGHLFPMNEDERKVYIPQRQRVEEARKQHDEGCVRPVQPGMGVPVLREM